MVNKLRTSFQRLGSLCFQQRLTTRPRPLVDTTSVIERVIEASGGAMPVPATVYFVTRSSESAIRLASLKNRYNLGLRDSCKSCGETGVRLMEYSGGHLAGDQISRRPANSSSAVLKAGIRTKSSFRSSASRCNQTRLLCPNNLSRSVRRRLPCAARSNRAANGSI